MKHLLNRSKLVCLTVRLSMEICAQATEEEETRDQSEGYLAKLG